jgi:hypothetical protein
MAEYRIRLPFRILLAVLVASLLVTSAYVVFVLEKSPLVDGGIILFALGTWVLLGRGALTGWMPSWIEEYGLDDPDEVEALRTDMARRGRFRP